MDEFLGFKADKYKVEIYLVIEKHGFYIRHGKELNWFITKKAALEYSKFLISGKE
jgi:hypothetical protein